MEGRSGVDHTVSPFSEVVFFSFSEARCVRTLVPDRETWLICSTGSAARIQAVKHQPILEGTVDGVDSGSCFISLPTL